MKKVLFSCFISVFLVSCSTRIYQLHYVVDLNPYSEQGFFITESNSVNFEYTPVGSVETIAGGVDNSGRNKNYDDVSYKYTQGRGYTLTTAGAMSMFVEKCKELKADAVINFGINTTLDKSGNPVHRISGMAIKMK